MRKAAPSDLDRPRLFSSIVGATGLPSVQLDVNETIRSHLFGKMLRPSGLAAHPGIWRLERTDRSQASKFMTKGEQTPKKIAKAAEPLVTKTSDGLNLSVQTYGDLGNDGILFIHGFGQSRLSWSKQTSSSLTEQYRVVTFDLRGHGNSDKPDHAAAYASGEQWRMIYTR